MGCGCKKKNQVQQVNVPTPQAINTEQDQLVEKVDELKSTQE